MVDKKDELKNLNNKSASKKLAPFSSKKIDTKPELKIEDGTKILISNEKEQLDHANETVKKQSSKKKKITSLLFMLLNIVIVAGILISQLQTNNVVSLGEIIKNSFNGWFFVLSIMLFFFYMIFESLKFMVLIKSSTKKSRPFVSYKTAALGKYYDAVTPMAAGGQPFQMFYLKSRGLNPSTSISVPLGKYMFFQIAYTILMTGVIFSTLSASSVYSNGVGGAVVSAASWIGYALNFCLVVTLILFSVNRKIGSKIITGVIKFLKKIRLVKNYDKVYNSAMHTARDFQESIQYYAKSPKTFAGSLVLAFATLIIKYSIPFFIYCTFIGYFDGGMWAEVFVKCAMIELAAGFVPLPGGTGVAELSFTALFASIFTSGQLFWALIFWRFLSYYGYIFQGILVLIYEYFIGNKKYNWLKKKWQLESESDNFKKEQLRNFKKKKRNFKRIKQ